MPQAIRILGATPDLDVLLTVPDMNPTLTSKERTRVFEYVLRRQPMLAEIYAAGMTKEDLYKGIERMFKEWRI